MENDFPVWKPTKNLLSKLDSLSEKEVFIAIRRNASSFISNPKVRQIIMDKSNHRCELCGNTQNLQIDHIKSVYTVAKTRVTLEELNSYDNLQVLCRSCNARKIL